MNEEDKARSLAIDTSLLFPMIRGAVHNATCKMIDGKRCFVIAENAYLRVMSYLFASARDMRFDPRIAAEGYENIEIAIGARDTHTYYLCAKMDPLLDKLWENKAPKEGPQ